MKVLLYGGSFNPPTVGHIAMAQKLSKMINELGFDKLWVMPCHSNFTGKKLESPQHRLDMCKIAFGNISDVVISDFEIANELNVETIDVVKNLIRTYPDTQFGFVFGSDCIGSFHEWSGHDELIKLCNFVIVNRKGYTLSGDTWYQNDPHRFIDIDIPKVSSTEFRQAIKLNDEDKVKQIIEYDIYCYIKSNSLYQ